MSPAKSHLDLINECDSFPYFHSDSEEYVQRVNSYYHLRVASLPSTTLGYILPTFALALSNLPDWAISAENTTPQTITLKTGNDEPSRSAAVAKTAAGVRETGQWKVLDKWRNELYAVYGPDGDVVFTVERSASPLFGVVTYGVHMTAYTVDKTSGDLKIWVPRRSRSKQTYPGMLDNSVAGGMAAGEEPFECMVREAMEEASLSEHVSRKAKAAGCVTYFYVRDERAGGETGLLQPECQYIYDLDLSNDEGVVCKPNDEEVEAFELMGISEVLKGLTDSEYKPNCALVLIDFLIRHGIITKETEKHYAQILTRLHRQLEFPMG